MMQIVEQTREEKIAMYMKCNKRALAEMLVNCNQFIESVTPKVIVTSREIKNHGNSNFRRTV